MKQYLMDIGECENTHLNVHRIWPSLTSILSSILFYPCLYECGHMCVSVCVEGWVYFRGSGGLSFYLLILLYVLTFYFGFNFWSTLCCIFYMHKKCYINWVAGSFMALLCWPPFLNPHSSIFTCSQWVSAELVKRFLLEVRQLKREIAIVPISN